MANDYSQENIFAHYLVHKCDMAIAGANLARKMNHTPLCNNDKIRFILAMIYLKIMLKKSEDSCITDDMLCDMHNYIKKYLGTSHFATRGCNCS